MFKFLVPLLLLVLAHIGFASEDQYEVLQDFEIFEESGEYLYYNSKSVSAYIHSSNGDFGGFVEFERFYSPLKGQRVTASKDLKGLMRERVEHVESHDVFIDDKKVHLVDFKEVKKGDAYHVLYTYQDTPIAWFPLIHAPRFDNVSLWKVTISFPEEIEVVPHIAFAGDTIPYTLSMNEDKLVVEFSSFERVKEKPGLDEDQPIATLLFEIKSNGALINAVTPETLTHWYYQQFPNDYSAAVDSLQLQRVFSQNLHGIEQFDSAFTFVKQNVRYIAAEDGMNAIIPSAPQSVIQRGWGDCKDKAYLVQALCDNESTKVFPVLVHTNRHTAFEQFTHVWMYNHVIAVFVNGTDTIYADPTNPYADIGTLGSSLYGSTALILDKENPKLVQLPQMSSDIGMELNIEVNKADPKSCNAQVTMTGFHAMRARMMFESTRSNRHTSALNVMISSYFRKLKVTNIDTVVMQGPRVVVTCSVDVSDLIIQGARSTYVSAMPFNFLSPALLERKDDKLALMLNGVRNVQLSLQVPGAVEVGEVETYAMKNQVHEFVFDVVSSEQDKSEIRFLTSRRIENLLGEEKHAYLESIGSLMEYRNKLIKIQW